MPNILFRNNVDNNNNNLSDLHPAAKKREFSIFIIF